MGHSPAPVPAMNSRSGSRGHWPSNGIDEHDDGLSRVGQFSVDHLDRKDHVVSAHLRFFAQGYDCFGHLALGATIETAALGGLSAKEFSPSVTSFMNASRVMWPAVRTGRSQKKMIFGFASLRVSRLPSKIIAFASWTNSMSQASSSARAGEANVARIRSL